MKPFRFHREADAKFTEALNHYTGLGPRLGGDFYDKIEKVIAAVCAHPRSSRQIDPRVRRHLVPKFPYGVLDIDEPDCVWIIAVAHLKRDPDYWKNRLTD